MKRLFSARQRKILRLLSGNTCVLCGEVIDKSFHADHVRSFVHGGKTILENGQALCADCNLKKGSSDGPN